MFPKASIESDAIVFSLRINQVLLEQKQPYYCINKLIFQHFKCGGMDIRLQLVKGLKPGLDSN